MTHGHKDRNVTLRLPEACRSIVLDGESLPIAADGRLETDAGTAAALEAHGAVPWHDEPQAGDIATLSREQLIDLFMARTLGAVKAQDTETIRTSLLEGEDEAPAPVTRDDIAQMSRAAVLSFLRARDVAAPGNASLVELRTRALDALGA